LDVAALSYIIPEMNAYAYKNGWHRQNLDTVKK